MPKIIGRRRLTCHHEGGHALVRWYFGHMTERAVVLNVEEVRAGKTVVNRRGVETRCEGVVDGYGIHDWPYVPTPVTGSPDDAAILRRHAEISRDIELINCVAGIEAEAAYRRKSAFVSALDGGSVDIKNSSEIRAAWFPDKGESNAAAHLADRRASALVRSVPGSAAIRAMADALMERGEIDGQEIEALCCNAYGGRQCQFGAWTDHWPPTLAQLRAGFIPESRAAAA